MIESVTINYLKEFIAAFGLSTTLVFVLLFIIWKMWKESIRRERDALKVITENSAVMAKLCERLKNATPTTRRGRRS